ncbi:thiamine-phosphate kinase [Chelatococcus reniformis]|uniref:Thiamine-monophosphate kinase n=1 Tax=Chelatococcus reniformis TaxID=1494448 RepID=A0A916UI84_9HYPH|nr:thiamine-phosphate kinase [Chelatococcus reniformis]GGC73991.1 thiamine-monophosphate kinase [Chelatococcus reniformis]
MGSGPLSEDDLIATIFAPLAGPGSLGLEDDVALLSLPDGHELVATTDGVVAGVHFFADDPPEAIARKSLRVNLSDLAAKGAEPLGFLLTLALQEGWTRPWLEAFAGGLGGDAAAYRCPLVGGDTVRTPGPLSVSITGLGHVPRGTMVKRTAARAGDVLAVTGTIGDAALGLGLRLGVAAAEAPAWAAALSAGEQAHILDRYLHPQPRLALASAMRARARCAMDVSDGLVGDLRKMLRASGVSAHVDLDRVPLSPAARRALAADASLAMTIFAGGDDYELLVTVAPGEVEPLGRAARAAGIGLSVIGEVVAGTAPPAFLSAGREVDFARGSYSHF